MKKTALIISLVTALLIIPCTVIFGFAAVFSGGFELIGTLPLSFFMVISTIVLVVDEAARII